MTIRQLIHSGPAKANELFAKLAETGNGALKTRERLFLELKAELELLAGLEEKHLFPALRKHEETKGLVTDALADNKQVRALLAELERMPKNGQDFSGKLAELRNVFQQHVRDEKRELLPAVSKALSEEEAQTVVERIEAGKAEAEAAQRAEAEKLRAEARREREKADAEEARRQEAERQETEKRQAEARREREAAERQKAEIVAAQRQAREAAAAMTRPVEVAAESGLRVVEAGSITTEAGAEMAAHGAQQGLDLAREATQRTAASASDAARRYQNAASEVFEAEADLTGLWLELAREHVAQHVEVFGKLAAARDWQEALEVQNAYVRDSFDRMNRLNSRYLAMVWTIMSPAGARDIGKKAA
jgi:hypothetical protein